MSTQPLTMYAAAGGREGMLALAHAWHERCLADPVAEHPFSHGGHPQHLERLAAYWGEALGGPPVYTESMGDETLARRLHAGNGHHPDLDRAVVACFVDAVEAVVPADDPRLRPGLVAYFTWADDPMTAYPDSPDDVPAGLALPHWSWDGPVSA